MALEKDDIRQLIAILQKGLQDDTETEQVVVPKKRKISKKSTPKPESQNIKKNTKIKSRSKKVIADPSDENLFVALGFDKLHKSDTRIDKKLWQSPPTPRHGKSRYVNVVCRVCGKKEKVSPSCIFERDVNRYKCNSCSSSAG